MFLGARISVATCSLRCTVECLCSDSFLRAWRDGSVCKMLKTSALRHMKDGWACQPTYNLNTWEDKTGGLWASSVAILSLWALGFARDPASVVKMENDQGRHLTSPMASIYMQTYTHEFLHTHEDNIYTRLMYIHIHIYIYTYTHTPTHTGREFKTLEHFRF